MDEIEEQDNLSQTEEQEKPKFRDAIKLFEDYRDSNYSKDYINELDEKDQCIIGYYIQLISDNFNIKLENRNNDLISRIAIAFLKAFEANATNTFYANKEYNVSIFLSSNILLNSICRYVIRCKYNETMDYISSLGKQKINYDNGVKFDIERIVNITYLLKMLFPYLYDDNEIETFISQFISINNTEEKVKFLVNFASASASRIKNEYQYTREFYEEVEKCIKEFYYSKLITPLGQRYLKLSRRSLETSRFIVLEFIEEYNRWKIDNNSYPDAFPSIRYFYLPYYLFIDNELLYYFFRTLNEPDAFDHNQIDYIREMAPKLQISSYMNEEYAKYKKWHNPDARDFDFGEDEPEEEQQHLDDCQTEEVVELGDNYVEETKQYHLDRLPHFTEDKFRKLLERFRKNDLNYIHKFTREEDWLFVFGLNGNTPPEGFKKVQWRGKNKKKKSKVSPLKFVNFLEILGYKLEELYDDVDLLNRCFIAKDEKDGKIIKKDFNYKNGQFLHVADYQELKKIVSEIGLCP